jgi:segregation and condensation protein B
MNTEFAKRVVETALICSPQPLGLTELRKLFDDELSADVMKSLLADIAAEWQHKGVELCTLVSGWRFQSKPEMRDYIDKLHPEKPPKYSRAVMETLAIIAYKQPVTRGDIEDIRGVAVNSEVLKRLEEREWVEAIGHREAPGRPALYATTKNFLSDLGLHSLEQLPALDPSMPITDAAQGLLSLDAGELGADTEEPVLSLPLYDEPLPTQGEADADAVTEHDAQVAPVTRAGDVEAKDEQTPTHLDEINNADSTALTTEIAPKPSPDIT